MDVFNELDTQDHVINGDTNKNIGSSPTGSIGWVQVGEYKHSILFSRTVWDLIMNICTA